MIKDVMTDITSRMTKSIDSFKTVLSKLRTGRAHPSLLEHISVEYYGTPTALNKIANISVEDSRTLTVVPFEKTMVAAIEKAIMTADLGLNPATSGTVIRVPLPALTEERRRDLVKLVRDEAERARVSVRGIRRDANTDIKDLVKSKLISEDDERRAETDIQKATDDTIKKIDAICAEKEKDIMAV